MWTLTPPPLVSPAARELSTSRRGRLSPAHHHLQLSLSKHPCPHPDPSGLGMGRPQQCRPQPAWVLKWKQATSEPASSVQALGLVGPFLVPPGPRHLSQDTAPRARRGLCPGLTTFPTPSHTHLSFFCEGRTGAAATKLLSTVPCGTGPGEEPRQPLGWGRGSPHPIHCSGGLFSPQPHQKSPFPRQPVGKLTINRTFLPRLQQAPRPRLPSLPLLLAPNTRRASPAAADLPGWAGGAHLPPRTASSPAGLWGLGSGTAKQLPPLSSARTPPRSLPESVPLPPAVAWLSGGEVVTELPLDLALGLGPC